MDLQADPALWKCTIQKYPFSEAMNDWLDKSFWQNSTPSGFCLGSPQARQRGGVAALDGSAASLKACWVCRSQGVALVPHILTSSLLPRASGG